MVVGSWPLVPWWEIPAPVRQTPVRNENVTGMYWITDFQVDGRKEVKFGWLEADPGPNRALTGSNLTSQVVNLIVVF